MCSNGSDRQPAYCGPMFHKETAVTMTVDTPVAEALPTRSDTPETLTAAGENTRQREYASARRTGV